MIRCFVRKAGLIKFTSRGESLGKGARELVPVFLLLVFHTASYCQSGLVDKAAQYLQKQELSKAKEAIDLASTHETTAGDPRTWYLKGFIYKELYKHQLAGKEDYRESALQFFEKSLTLDRQKTYQKNCRIAIGYLHDTYFNEATEYFNQQQFEKALVPFRKYLQARAKEPADSVYAEALYYTGYASEMTGQQPAALQYYEQALRLQYANPLLYQDLARLYESLNKPGEAKAVIEAGRKKFPRDTGLRVVEINALLAQQRFSQAEKLVSEYLAIDPNNIDVLLVSGTVYEKMSKSDSLNREKYFRKRKEAYGRVLTVDPNNYLANYNMGITLYNRGVDLIKSQPVDLDIVVLYEILERVSLLFQEARPYVEKAYSLAPNNLNAMKALEGIYYNLNEREKSSQIRSKINQMK